VADSVIRGIALALLVLLAACARGANGVGSGPPGIDVADAALKGGSPEIAAQIAGNILATNPGNEDALLTKGEALTQLGQTGEAAATFSAALAVNPNSVGANIGLGRLRLSTDPSSAERLFLQALSREPRNDVALNDLGIARDLQGRHTDAQMAYRQALGISPEMSAAQVNLALSLAMGGQSHDAVLLLRPLAERPGASQQTRHDLAAVLTMNGDRAAAAEILSKDLPPEQVQEALSAFASARPNAAAAMLGAAPLPAPVPPVAASVLPVTARASATPSPAPPPSAAAAPAITPATASVAPPVSPLPPPAPERTAAVQAAGVVVVQLAGPVPSRSAAQMKWDRLAKEMPGELGGHAPIMAKLEEHGHTVWRVRTGGFADGGAASSFCDHVRMAGTSCKVVE
jgi:Flp pilus assembly protein TadD